MRRFFLLFLLFFLSLPTLAQGEDYPMPDLPAEPVFSDAWATYYTHSYQWAWLDNETLVFTPYDRWYSLPEDSPYETYSYNLSDSSLISLDEPLFRANWNSEWRETFKAQPELEIYRSPYEIRFQQGDETEYVSAVTVLYQSSYYISCGPECSGTMIMIGSYQEDPTIETPRHAYYEPLDFTSGFDIKVHWSPNPATFVVESETGYGGGNLLIYQSYGNESVIRHPLTYTPNDQFLAFSPSARRVAIATGVAFDENYTTNEQWWQKLIIWDAPPEDPECECTYHEGSAQVIYSPSNQEDYRRRNFAGVGFVDEDTILYIGNEGLFKHTISTGESILLDPAFNTHWINLAIFSPDNRHVAVTTAQGLYVLPTGYEG